LGGRARRDAPEPRSGPVVIPNKGDWLAADESVSAPAAPLWGGFPSSLGKVARSAGWGVARCFKPSRIARPSARTCNVPYLLSAPHPAFGHLPRFAEKGNPGRRLQPKHREFDLCECGSPQGRRESLPSQAGRCCRTGNSELFNWKIYDSRRQLRLIAQLRGSLKPATARLEVLASREPILVGDLILLEVLQGARDA